MSSRRRITRAKATELGDLTFDDWYETPVFETEPDERLEQLATSRRAPVRIIGSAMLRLSPARGDTLPDDREPAPGRELDRNRNRGRMSRPSRDVRREPAASYGVGPAGDTGTGVPGEAAGSWRERAARLLDRWADMEVSSQERLEELVLPKRWRG